MAEAAVAEAEEITRSTRYEQYPQLLRVREVANIMGLTTWTIYQLIAQGEIPHRRIGKTILVPREFFAPEKAQPQVVTMQQVLREAEILRSARHKGLL